MFCKKCGAQLETGKAFCPKCGASQAPVQEAPVQEAPFQETSVSGNSYQQPAYQQPAYQPPVYQPAPSYSAQGKEAPDASSLMVKGIVGAALCEIGIPGIVLGNLAVNGVEQRKSEGYEYSGMLKAAYICGKVAKIVGIIMTVFWAVYILIFVLILGNL